MSTKRNTPQTKQAKNAKTQQETDSADPAMASEIASVQTTHPAPSVPLADIPTRLFESFIERKIDEGRYRHLPEFLSSQLHVIPRSMWPNPTPIELARLVVECGWKDHMDGAKQAMNLLWLSSYATYASLKSAESWVRMVESEAPNEASQMAANMGCDFTKLSDSISHADFMSFFNTDPLKLDGKKIRGDALFDYWIQLPDTIHHLSRYGLSHIRDDLPNFHAQMKIHGAKAEDWSSCFAPDENDWLKLPVIIGFFNTWRTKTAEENMKTGRGNLRLGKESPDTATPPVDPAPAGKTHQVKKTGKNKKVDQNEEITPAQTKTMNKALDTALNNPNLGTGGSRKS